MIRLLELYLCLLGATESSILISEVQTIVITTWWIRSSIAFACGYLMLVGLGFTPYDSHRAIMLSLNSIPLSNIIF